MRFSTIVVAAFVALTADVSAAPVEVRGQRTAPSYSKTVLSNNKNNGFVAYSGNGGNGGSNVANPEAESYVWSENKKVSGSNIFTGSAAGNVVGQSANGGDGSAVGSYGSGNYFGKRTGTSPVYVAPSVDVLSNNDDNGVVIGSGNGGAGGWNVANPVAYSGVDSTNKYVHGGKIITTSKSGNIVGQSANGGSGSAVGTYGSKNKFYVREVEIDERDLDERELDERTTRTKPSYSYLSGNSNNGFVYGSGNGGDGGSNKANPVAISEVDSTNKYVWGGKIITGSSAGNTVLQSADGGSGNAVGTYGSNNHFSS